MFKPTNMKKLQRLIDRVVTDNNKAFFAKQKLDEYCVELYGTTASDLSNMGSVAADEIVDCVLGSGDPVNGMDAEEFDFKMRDAIGAWDE